MYVAVKGGERAISNAHKLLRENGESRNGSFVEADQIKDQFSFAVDRIMAEGSLYDRDLAAKAFKQAQGDIVEAVFLMRAYRNTLPRFGYTKAINTEEIEIKRRISATFKDIPGGQILGATFDYTHRLLGLNDDEDIEQEPVETKKSGYQGRYPRVTGFFEEEGLLNREKPGDDEPGDLTRTPFDLPAPRDLRLQNLARGDEGFLLSLAYSYERGFGADNHPFAAEIRNGEVEVEIEADELGFEICAGTINITEVIMVDAFHGTSEKPPQLGSGYGLTFGKNERKAMSMAIIDRAMQYEEFGEECKYPSQNHEFILSHSDNVEAAGFVSHLKLPHYVDFQSELTVIRRLRKKYLEKINAEKKVNGEKIESREKTGESV